MKGWIYQHTDKHGDGQPVMGLIRLLQLIEATAAAQLLADRCRLLVRIDPNGNIHANDIVHERAQCVLEDYVTDRRFDLVTLRMVARPMSRPARANTPSNKASSAASAIRIKAAIIGYSRG
jgi:hypothetical protein